jgi:sulfur carrier protein ThiS adenylyltransferase
MKFDDIRNLLKDRRVGIAGAGGLGSNCAMALARSGVGNLVIADFDIIDFKNLNRQYYFYEQLGKKKVLALKENIQKVYPDTHVIPYAIKLDPPLITKLFADCDVIVEAFDLQEMKEMIMETVLGQMPGVPLVMGSGLAGWGKNHLIRTEKLDNLYICGDQLLEVTEEQPPLAPRVGIVAMMQANQVLEILLGDMIV